MLAVSNQDHHFQTLLRALTDNCCLHEAICVARDLAANHTEPAIILSHLLQRARAVPAERRAVLLRQLERPGGMPTTGGRSFDVLVRELARELRGGGGLDVARLPHGPELGELDVVRVPYDMESGGLDARLSSSAGLKGAALAAVALSLGTEELGGREVRLLNGGAGSKVDAPTALGVPLGCDELGKSLCCGAAEPKASGASTGPGDSNPRAMVKVRMGLTYYVLCVGYFIRSGFHPSINCTHYFGYKGVGISRDKFLDCIR